MVRYYRYAQRLLAYRYRTWRGCVQCYLSALFIFCNHSASFTQSLSADNGGKRYSGIYSLRNNDYCFLQKFNISEFICQLSPNNTNAQEIKRYCLRESGSGFHWQNCYVFEENFVQPLENKSILCYD